MANISTLPLRVFSAINGESMEHGDVVEVAGRYMFIMGTAVVGEHYGVGFSAAYAAREVNAPAGAVEDIFLPVGTLVDLHFGG